MKTNRIHILIVLLLATPVALRAAETGGAPLLKHGNVRVVLIGDSITGQSRNYSAGFAHQMDWALKQAYPDCQPNLIALESELIDKGPVVPVTTY